MKRRTFISMLSVMAAAGVLTLSGCSNSSTPPLQAPVHPLLPVPLLTSWLPFKPVAS